jgi:hypothetical protein
MNHLQDRATREMHLSYLQPVPRTLVHRAAIAEVFITDAVPLDEETHLVAAQWPRDHVIYHPDAAGVTDPLLFAETLRQSLVYVAHAYQGIPLGHRFIGEFLEVAVTDPEPLRVGDEPLAAVLESRLHWLDRRPGRERFRLEAELQIQGRPCGTGRIQVLAVDDRRYRVLRGRGSRPAPDTRSASESGRAESGRAVGRDAGARPPVHSPEALGKLRWKDCVIGAQTGPSTWQLAVDSNHAALYDHRSDHLPMMVLAEAFRQLGHLLGHRSWAEAADPWLMSGLRVDCLRWGELDTPTELAVSRPLALPGRSWEITASQHGEPIASARIVWTKPATAAPATAANGLRRPERLSA